jgi:hypothetical protein
VAKIKNISGEDRNVPWLGGRLVLAGAVVEVAPDQVTAFTQQEGTWAPADKQAETLHEEMLGGIAVLRAGQDAAEADPDEVVEEHSADELIKTVVPGLDEPGALHELRAAEDARSKPRTTVLAAIDERLAELDTDDNEES